MTTLVSNKRSIPRDFFSSARKRVPKPQPQKQSCVTPLTNSSQVPGLRIILDFITQQEEDSILAYLNSDACNWRTDLSRRTMHFGGQYCLYSRSVKGVPPSPPEILEAPPLPEALNWIIDRFVQAGIYKEINDKRPEYVIVNEYLNKQGISAHTENFSFYSPVLGLSLGSTDVIRFRELESAFAGSVRSGKAGSAPRTGKIVDVTVAGRSLCVMSGLSRWNWQHEITPRVRKPGFKRVSLTFRVKKK